MEDRRRMFCSGGGCTAKLGPAALQRVLSRLPAAEDENLLVGYSHGDDGAVYRLSEDLAVIHTLDFFPPVVEDPYLFGQIAATNALSDIYAMGGDVKTALNIVCFPEQMDLNILGDILTGGSEKVRESGGILAGGHSIADEGIKYRAFRVRYGPSPADAAEPYLPDRRCAASDQASGGRHRLRGQPAAGGGSGGF